MDKQHDQPCPSPFNMAAYVLAAAAHAPDKIALEVLADEKQCWSFAQIESAVRGVATGLLNTGLQENDLVMLRIGNTADFPIAYLGIIAVGMVAVPTSSALTQSEITKMAQAVKPSAILQDDALAVPEIRGAQSISLGSLRDMYALPPAPWHMADAERPAYVVFTSGTSAAPRAVQHAHRAIWARRMMHKDWYDISSEDRLLHAGAFNWTFTLGTGLMDPWSVGATALIAKDGTPPENLPYLLAQSKATLFAAAPGVFRKIVRVHMPKLPHLRHALSAGEKMPVALHAAWTEATGLKVYEAFGMSECSTFISSSPQRETSPDHIGLPQKGRNVAVLTQEGNPAPVGEIGTIAIHRSDPGLMLGYLNDTAGTKARFQGEWFLTGDLGQTDAKGAISYAGRSDDMINAGGFRVSPLEIETVFQRNRAINQCAAIEVKLKTGVSLIALCYVTEGDLEQNELEALANQHLARYKHPRIYHPCDTLPSSANGKLLRRVLRAQIEAHYG
ncbi:class I adenylate-forming enzyme family protein [Planktotalea sp.]|uniref:class I adenylate-forming enzyme family protein n=1 Tax=Planktotalea sp. TaxID=2029877 RepID=UPI0035C85D43